MELVVRKMHRQKIIVFFVAGVVGIFRTEVVSYQRSRRSTMMAIGNVSSGQGCKGIHDLADRIRVAYNPQPVTDAVVGNEVVLRLFLLYCCYHFVDSLK